MDNESSAATLAQPERPSVPVSAPPPKPPIWSRYGFLLGIAANVAVVVSCVHFFFLSYGSTLPSDDWAFPFIWMVSFFAVVVGSVLCFWGMGKQRARGGSIALDLMGLVLNWLPYPLAMFLIHWAVTVCRLWDGG